MRVRSGRDPVVWSGGRIAPRSEADLTAEEASNPEVQSALEAGRLSRLTSASEPEDVPAVAAPPSPSVPLRFPEPARAEVQAEVSVAVSVAVSVGAPAPTAEEEDAPDSPPAPTDDPHGSSEGDDTEDDAP